MIDGEMYESCDRCSELRIKMPEFIPERIKEERVKFRDHLLQPHREGEASREYIEKYPDSARQMFSESEIKNARYVWKGDI